VPLLLFFATPARLYLMACQLLTLYTTPVVYLYLDRLQSRLKPDAAAPGHVPEDAHTPAAIVQLSARLKPGE
jgi:hypothetical protein